MPRWRRARCQQQATNVVGLSHTLSSISEADDLAAPPDPAASEDLEAPLITRRARTQSEDAALMTNRAAAKGQTEHLGLLHSYPCWRKSHALQRIGHVLVPGLVLTIGIATSMIALATINQPT